MNYSRYFVVYKPFQTLSQFTSQDNKHTLKDFFPVPSDIYPVGRLDFDSEGLLILTNDTSLNHKLLNPNFAHSREYWLQVDGAITGSAVEQLQKGVDINISGKIYRTQKCIAEIFTKEPKMPERHPPIRFRKDIPAPWIKIILNEGKNRQVRKMCANVGFPVLRLVRVRIENITLESIQPGGMREVSKAEIAKGLKIKL
ncbi:pseudouridine synthase [Arachidicoccus sp.]|uniref:pseudouridine synthase n=1 Tax=Arachidicoccus sp. TaxID=1872624 RepID=UPI003D2432A5